MDRKRSILQFDKPIQIWSMAEGTTGSLGEGVPGYTYEEGIAGIFLGVVVLLLARRKQ